MTQGRLIDADALLEKLSKKDNEVHIGLVMHLIDSMPTVHRDGWVSVPIELLKDITNCFDNVPNRRTKT